MDKDEAIRNLLTNIINDIKRSGRTTLDLSVVQCEVSKALIEMAEYTLEESNNEQKT